MDITASSPGTTRVLIAGGGVAALEAMLAVRELAEERVEIVLLSARPEFEYRPLAVLEPFGLGEVHRFDLADLAAEAGASVRVDALTEVDSAAKATRTRDGAELAYDALLVACGATMQEALPGAITFWGEGESGFQDLLAEVREGRAQEIAFAVPPGATWPLPLYELALLTASRLRSYRVAVRVVTPEPSPLAIFGREASESVAALLERRGIEVCTGQYAASVEHGELRLVPEGSVRADRVVTMPRLAGVELPGLPADPEGFIPVDEHQRVPGIDGVYAAGDVTTVAIKQGGIAAQQADAAAEAIAAAAGAQLEPRPFRPVLRGLLLTGDEPAFLRAEVSGGRGEASEAVPEPLWWPPGKIVGRRLAPLLAGRAGGELHRPRPAGEAVSALEVELDQGMFKPSAGRLDPSSLQPGAGKQGASGEAGPSADDVLEEWRLRYLIAAGRTLVSMLDLETILTRLLETARELTAARYAAVGVLDSSRQALESFIAIGIDEEIRAGIGEPPRGRGILGLLISDPRPLRIDDVRRHPSSSGFPPGHPEMRGFLGVPIMIGGRAFGNLYLTDSERGRFDEADEQSVVVLADWAAVAIQNARSVAADRLRERIEASERERGHWARELHDETLQGLGVLHLVLASALRSGDHPALVEATRSSLQQLEEETEKLRALISELRPAALDEIGLEAALEGLARRSATRSGLDVRASIELSARPGPPLDPERESAVYRIVQEALTNVERHGRAEEVEVVVAERAGEIEIRVEDDGVGFDTRKIPGGFGLRGMRERADSSGGRLTVDSDPGAGTRVRATIPSARPRGAGILDRNAGLEGS